jgi:hypothetical protein
MEIESTVRVGVGGTAATNPQEEEDYGGNSQYAHIDITTALRCVDAFSDRRDAWQYWTFTSTASIQPHLVYTFYIGYLCSYTFILFY